MSASEELIKFLEDVRRVQERCFRLKTKGYRYASIEDFLLKEGRAFEPVPRPNGITKMADKQCFKNCFQLATASRGKYRYAEGYGASIIPVSHAWLVDGEGNAVDPTWRNPGSAYFGIVIPEKLLLTIVLRKGTYGCLDDWENRWPILKNGLDGVLESYEKED